MFYNAARDPCRIVDSDSEDERNIQSRTNISFTTRPSTPRIVTRPLQSKIIAWDTTSNNTTNNLVPSNRISSASSEGSSSELNRAQISIAPPITTPESPPSTPAITNSSNFDPILLIQEDLSKFANTHIPKDYPSFVQCTLRRDKDGVQGGFFPTFYLQAERPTDRKKFFLLAARKVAKVNRQSEYLITTNIETLSEKSGGDGYMGKLRGHNLTGTEYVLYDNGIKKSSHHKHSNNNNNNNNENLRRELAAIVYNTNILGFKGPRQMTAMLPELGHDIRPTKEQPSILEQWKNRRLNYLIQLRNKTPKYNEETKTYVLQFTGNRVAQPSVKNFQMIIENENHEEEVVMQFGRVDNDTFTCDYRYPLTAVQAFGIALSSFDSRIIRE